MESEFLVTSSPPIKLLDVINFVNTLLFSNVLLFKLCSSIYVRIRQVDLLRSSTDRVQSACNMYAGDQMWKKKRGNAPSWTDSLLDIFVALALTGFVLVAALLPTGAYSGGSFWIWGQTFVTFTITLLGHFLKTNLCIRCILSSSLILKSLNIY